MYDGILIVNSSYAFPGYSSWFISSLISQHGKYFSSFDMSNFVLGFFNLYKL
jgi:hypothetical protein